MIIMAFPDLVYVHCDFVLGRFEASNGIRLWALVLGCHALLGCPTHCPWQGRFGFRVRVPILVSPSYTNEYSSLWTKYTVAGECKYSSMNEHLTLFPQRFLGHSFLLCSSFPYTPLLPLPLDSLPNTTDLCLVYGLTLCFILSLSLFPSSA
jgi:hypothetical protein